MGLDMYLTARRYTSEYSDTDVNQQLRPIANVYLPPAARDYDSITVERDVAYWRKANQIHAWFVANVQDGNDDCNSYDVDMERLVELRDTCQRVLDGSKLKKAKINNGYTMKKSKMTPIKEDGFVIADPTIAKKLLPAVDGFFFGGTEYSQYYLDDIKSTIEQLDTIIAWCNATQALLNLEYCPINFQYRASW